MPVGEEEKSNKELLTQITKLNEALEEVNFSKRITDIPPTRVDLKTRICFMATFIYGAMGDVKPEEAVEAAVNIENLTDARVKKMKDDNPILLRPPRRYGKDK